MCYASGKFGTSGVVYVGWYKFSVRAMNFTYRTICAKMLQFCESYTNLSVTMLSNYAANVSTIQNF